MQATISPITKKDIALSNFAKALALPVRVRIIRRIIEEGNEATRDQLHEIPFNQNTINQHLLELKNLGILKTQAKGRTMFYSINEQLFVSMSNSFLDLFDSINDLGVLSEKIDSKPVVRKKKVISGAVIEREVLPDEESGQTFGEFIKAKRKELHLTQEDLAMQIQVVRTHMSHIECGKNTLRPEKLTKLAETFMMPIDEIKRIYYSARITELAKEGNMNKLVLNIKPAVQAETNHLKESTELPIKG